ncbi:MAG TPA: hypothetical protein VJL28_03680 [Gemmatimonadaceae bacterium]|nr:hypothetical protein [Gemmatimonadaceae bacterium]
MTQSRRALIGVGALLLAGALVLTITWDILLRRRVEYYRDLIARAPPTATQQQVASDAYHYGHVKASFDKRWELGGYAMVGTCVAAVGAALVLLPLALARRRSSAA